jgi:hypothetical protein
MARPGRPERNRPDHSTSVGDSVTSSTRMRFSAHTGGRRSQCCPTVINIFYQAHCWQGMRDSYLVENTAMSLSGERVFLAVRQARLGRESHWPKSGSEKGPTQDVQCARNSLSQWCGKPPTTTERDWSRLCWRKILHLDIARAQAELPVSRSAENAAHASGGLFLSGAGLITAVGSRTK